MKNASWRVILAAVNRPLKSVEHYKAESGHEIPNATNFSGDKFPSGTGDSAKVEVREWKDGNSLGQKDIKRERGAAEFGSALMSEDVRRKNLKNHMKDEGVKPSYSTIVDFNDTATSKRFSSWRRIFSDMSLKQKPDGTVQLDITSQPGQPLFNNTATGQPGALSPQQTQQTTTPPDKAQNTAPSTAKAPTKAQKIAHHNEELPPDKLNMTVKELLDALESKAPDVYQKIEELLKVMDATPKSKLAAFREALRVEGNTFEEWYAENADNQELVDEYHQYVQATQAADVEEPKVFEDWMRDKYASAMQPAIAASTSTKKWLINKVGSFRLIGKECGTHAGISITQDHKELEFMRIAKRGHSWNEVIPQGVWDTKMTEYVESKNDSVA